MKGTIDGHAMPPTTRFRGWSKALDLAHAKEILRSVSLRRTLHWLGEMWSKNPATPLREHCSAWPGMACGCVFDRPGGGDVFLQGFF